MIIKCKTNLIKDIPKEYLNYHQTTHERDLLLTPDKQYVVMGLESESGLLLYYIPNDQGVVQWVSPFLFDIIDNSIPGDWLIRQRFTKNAMDFEISFPRWLDPEFKTNYYDYRQEEINFMERKIEEYKK